MLVRISENVHVDPAEVACVEVHHERNCVHVCLRGGTVYTLGPDYGKSVWDKQSALIAALNAKAPSRVLHALAIDLRNAYDAKDRVAHESTLARLEAAGS